MPFLEVLTRHYIKRPYGLEANQASLDALISDDWTQTLLVDDVGRGVGWANTQLAEYAPHLEGDYIWILDDDDQCIYPALLDDLQRIVAEHDPDVVFVRMDHGPKLGILPAADQWDAPPVLAKIGVSSVIVRRSTFQTHADAWRIGPLNGYASDFSFIDTIWRSRPRVYWHDVVASRITRRSMGAPEEPPKLPLGVTEAAEYQMLRAELPGLFGGAARSMLYVGANQIRPPYHAQRLRMGGWRLHLLEIFPGNIDYHKHTGLFETLTLGDVRHDSLPSGPFDAVMWWHGCEHIPQADLAPTLARLEAAAPFVVLGCPDGYMAQGEVYGNRAEIHQWSVSAGDLERLGYTVVAYPAEGTDGHTRHDLLAWKESGEK